MLAVYQVIAATKQDVAERDRGRYGHRLYIAGLTIRLYACGGQVIIAAFN